LPGFSDCATNIAGLSASAMVNTPFVLMAAGVSPSVRFLTCEERTAASLVPAILIVTEVVVPSTLVTTNLSV
jgi:hypothetical protein